MSNYKQFCVSCLGCGSLTSKAYARKNGGKCKSCAIGVERKSKDIPDHERAGYFDRGEYQMSAEYAHEVRGGNELSPDY